MNPLSIEQSQDLGKHVGENTGKGGMDRPKQRTETGNADCPPQNADNVDRIDGNIQVGIPNIY